MSLYCSRACAFIINTIDVDGIYGGCDAIVYDKGQAVSRALHRKENTQIRYDVSDPDHTYVCPAARCFTEWAMQNKEERQLTYRYTLVHLAPDAECRRAGGI